MENREDWDDLRVVLAVARTRSFAGAAQVLKVNESTVFRRIANAEKRLHARLFERKEGRITPTRAGEEVAERAARVEDLVLDASNAIHGADSSVSGTVRITSVPLLVHRFLLPALPGLLGRYPDLQIEFLAETRVLSLGRREADIALRLARPVDGVRAIARKVGELRYGVYATHTGDPDALPWVTYEAGMGHLPPADWMARHCSAESLSRVRVNDGEGLLACVQGGLGKTLLPCRVADPIPGLRRLDAWPCALVRELWLVVHPDLRKLDRVRVVMDWIIDLCSDLAEPSSMPQNAATPRNRAEVRP